MTRCLSALFAAFCIFREFCLSNLFSVALQARFAWRESRVMFRNFRQKIAFAFSYSVWHLMLSVRIMIGVSCLHRCPMYLIHLFHLQVDYKKLAECLAAKLESLGKQSHFFLLFRMKCYGLKTLSLLSAFLILLHLFDIISKRLSWIPFTCPWVVLENQECDKGEQIGGKMGVELELRIEPFCPRWNWICQLIDSKC